MRLYCNAANTATSEIGVKNPWMSMWLSAMNSAAGASRGFWMAEWQRQQQAFLKEMTRSSVCGPWVASPRRKTSGGRSK
jgi:hypothetical protein